MSQLSTNIPNADLPAGLRAEALRLHAAGLCVLPADPGKKFTTLDAWGEYQKRLPTSYEVEHWFTGAPGLCIVTGAVSGNLEVIDFDCRAEWFPKWKEIVEAEAPGLLQRLYVERSQSGGKHVVYRCEQPAGRNAKLAQKTVAAPSDDELVIDGKRYKPRKVGDRFEVVLTPIETRAEGGLIMCAPTRGYVREQGDLASLPVLSADERDTLLSAARSLNEVHAEPVETPVAGAVGNRPGDDFNRRGDVRTLLIQAGWKRVQGGDNEYWARPGKTGGHSATLKNGVFYVFSSNAPPFEPDAPYSPFAVYALLRYEGDFSKAAAALRADGYGEPRSGDRGANGDAESAPSGKLPSIILGIDAKKTTDEAIAALAADQETFKRGPMLVRVIHNECGPSSIKRAAGTPSICMLLPPTLRERLTCHARFLKPIDDGKFIPVHPPQGLIAQVAARGEWPSIRYLAAVSEIPVLRADGSILQVPGYDAATCVLYEPGLKFPPIPDHPTLEDAKRAVEELIEIVVDFPFETPAHKSAWLAALLTCMSRQAFEGPAPMFVVDANTPGCGKGRLAEVIEQIARGRPMPTSSYVQDRDEMDKRITAIALAGDQVILLDNIEGRLGNATLDAALTCTGTWQGRMLGKSERVNLPLSVVWFATGNNIELTGDIHRRVVRIRLDSIEEQPGLRTGFKHPNLVGWVTENRARFVVAALTVLSAYCRAGRPDVGLRAFGSFEKWSALIRGALVWVGQPDPNQTRDQLVGSGDTTLDDLRQLLKAMKAYDDRGKGFVWATVIPTLYPPKNDEAPKDPPSIELRYALENCLSCAPGKAPSTKQVGKFLGRHRGRVVGGLRLDPLQENSRGGLTWHVIEVVSAGAHVCMSESLVSPPFARGGIETEENSIVQGPELNIQTCTHADGPPLLPETGGDVTGDEDRGQVEHRVESESDEEPPF